MSRRGLISVAAAVPAGLCVAFALLRLSGVGVGFPLFPLLAYTPYAAVVALLAGAWALLLRRPWAAAAGALACLAMVAVVVPRMFGDEQPPAGGEALRVMSLNLGLGRADPDSVAELVRSEGVDVLALQELTPRAARELRDRVGPMLPHAVLAAEGGAFGSGVMSAEPLRQMPTIELASSRRPSVTELAPRGGPALEVWSIHPPPPTSGENVEELTTYLDSLPPGDEEGALPRLLAGDFNSTLDHPPFRDLVGRGYADAADSLGDGLVPTWPTDRFPPEVTIDHVLGSDGDFAFSELSTRTIPETDHRALLVTARPSVSE